MTRSEWITPMLKSLTDDQLVELRAKLDAEMSHREPWAAHRFGEEMPWAISNDTIDESVEL